MKPTDFLKAEKPSFNDLIEAYRSYLQMIIIERYLLVKEAELQLENDPEAVLNTEVGNIPLKDALNLRKKSLKELMIRFDKAQKINSYQDIEFN